MAIDALVEAILVAGGAVLHLVLQQKVKRIVLNSAVQFAFVAGRDWNREKDGGNVINYREYCDGRVPRVARGYIIPK